jgi:hypothetical protein
MLLVFLIDEEAEQARIRCGFPTVSSWVQEDDSFSGKRQPKSEEGV